MSPLDYSGVVLACPVTVPYARHSPHDAHWWTGRALAGLAAAAGVAHTQFDGLALASFSLAPDTTIALTQHFGLTPRYIDFLPLGGVSGILALRRTARAVQAGDADLIACIAADSHRPGSFADLVAGFSRFSQSAVWPYGSGGPNASFALIAVAYMDRTGATRADFGKLAVAQRAWAASNPHALLRAPMTLDDYLAARPIAPPIHLYDCVMPCAGAEGFLVLREETAKAQGLPFVRLAAAVERHNAFPDDDVQVRGGWAMDRDVMWGMAGAGPQADDLVMTYDDYPVISMLQFEGLGLCAEGEGPEFIRAHDFGPRGDVAHNVSGGQLSVGQAGCAGGFLGLTEALRRLIAGDYRRALVSGFGMIAYDRGLGTGAVVLEAA